MIKSILTIAVALASFFAMGQTEKSETVIIDGKNAVLEGHGDGTLMVSSSIVCEMCKSTIENGLAYVDGIKSAKVDVDDNLITVKYKPKKISEQEVKEKITELGYAAGNMQPNKEAYDKLDGCCKKDGACND